MAKITQNTVTDLLLLSQKLRCRQMKNRAVNSASSQMLALTFVYQNDTKVV